MGIFKALGDATRLRVINLLSQGELCICDLMEALALPQSTLSRHVAILKRAGLVQGRREGVWMHYQLTTGTPFTQSLMGLLMQIFQEDPVFRQDSETLAGYVASKKADACANTRETK